MLQLEKDHPELQIGICLQNRLNETTEKLKELIEMKRMEGNGNPGHGALGPSKEYYDVKPWRGKWKTAGGGCMINQSVHTLGSSVLSCRTDQTSESICQSGAGLRH